MDENPGITPPGRCAATLPIEGRESGTVAPGRAKQSAATRSRANALRRKLTDAEARLWIHLKRVRTVDNHFRKQVPIGPYVADFACLRGKLIVEVDGAQHGFHTVSSKDKARTAFLNAQGFRVLRFWNGDILRDMDAVLDTIYAALYGAVDAPLRSMSRRQGVAFSSPSMGEVPSVSEAEGVYLTFSGGV